MIDNLTAALNIAGKGKPIFPCNNNKRPLTQHGFKDATTDSDTISEWWKQFPSALVGMPTGKVSGVVVLDIDNKNGHDGDGAIASLEKENSTLPDTMTVITPNAGLHLYFNNPDTSINSSANRLGDGLDIRGDGGYIILPPSQIDGTPYKQINGSEIVNMPQWLIDKTKKKQPIKKVVINQTELTDINDALRYIPADDRDTWLSIGMALHSTGRGDAFFLWDSWSQSSEKYSPDSTRGTWDSFKSGGVNIGTLFHLAKQNGRTHHNDSRRRLQISENKEVGKGIAAIPKAEKITLEGALDKYVLVTDGKRVADRDNPQHDLALDEWRLLHKASTRVDDKGKTISTADEWISDINRITAHGKTFKAGDGEFVTNPKGVLCLNTWKQLYRPDEVDKQYLHIFLEHLEFLIPDEITRNRFLDWLAHIEQMPGELPHTGWLHIATSTGMGRNWLMSVLVRVWAGYVAANFNLMGTLNSGFNGELSRVVLANVDELHEGGQGQWQHAERLKSTMTEEFKTINPKYGRASIEFNACRWLLYSNHLSALPIASNDRRLEVVVNEGKPESASYYKRLYSALKHKSFISSVANFFINRDISSFNPGAHAIWTIDKQTVANTSKTAMTEIAELAVKHWPEDLISAQALLDILNSEKDGYPSTRMNAQMNKTLEELGIKRHDIRKDIGDRKQYVYILRNHKKWGVDELSTVNVEQTFGEAKAGNALIPRLAADLLLRNID